MKYLYLETYKDFKCIGSECPFTCCGGWNIKIDPVTDEYYKTVNGEFGERLRNSINTEDGISSFTLKDNGDCPFLNEKKLCDIYINLGEEHLCHTCTFYPRYSYSSGDIIFSGVSISCPEVARFLLAYGDKLQIDFTETEVKLQNESGMDWEAFNQSVRVFTNSIAIVQNREFTLKERLAVLTLFLYQYQTLIDGKRSTNGLLELFGKASYFDEILPQTGIYRRDFKSKADYCIELMRYFRGFRSFEAKLPELADLVIYFKNTENPMTTDKLSSALSCFDNEEEQVWQEQVLTYALFRYFMQGVEKKDYYNKYLTVLILVYWFYIATMVMYYQQWDKMPEFDERVMMIAHISRVVEHDNRLRDDALENFREKGMIDLFFILRLIS